MKTKEERLALKRQREDQMRSFRVVRYLDFPSIMSGSPVEVTEGFIVSDRESCEVFASFVFKNVGEKALFGLKIRLLFYQNQNIPYLKSDFVYSHNDFRFGMIAAPSGKRYGIRESNKRVSVKSGESFGAHVFIPLPESYFTKLEVKICSVEYTGGEKQEIGIVAGGSVKKYDDLDNISKLAYTRINKYESFEYTFPTVVIPKETESAWLCCCGNKNPAASSECTRCGREKNWQMESISEDALAHSTAELVKDPTEITMHDKSRYRQNKMLETQQEIEKKIADYEKAMLRLAEAEKNRRRRNKYVIPKLIALTAVLALFALIVYILQKGGLVVFPYSA